MNPHRTGPNWNSQRNWSSGGTDIRGPIDPHRVCLIVVLDPFVGDLGQDVVRLLLLVFGIADHDLDHRRLKLRQSPDACTELLQDRRTVFI